MKMKTKIVYVLVSDSSDYYYEQALISVTSARMWNSDAEIVVVVDDRTNVTLTDGREALGNVVQQKIVVNLSPEMNKKRRSRILKTSLRELVVGDFLYIDTDTVVCDSLAEIDNFCCEIGAVLDQHTTLQRMRDYQVLERVQLLGGTIEDGDTYYNGGVFYVKDTSRTHIFFRDWRMLYEQGLDKGMDRDQPALFLCNKKHQLIESLNGVYNCLIFSGGLPFLADAKILHAFNGFGFSDFFLFNDVSYYKKIREQESLTEEDLQLIKSCRKQFVGEYSLLYGKQLGYAKSVLFHLYNENRSFFQFVESIGKVLLRLQRHFK